MNDLLIVRERVINVVMVLNCEGASRKFNGGGICAGNELQDFILSQTTYCVSPFKHMGLR